MSETANLFITSSGESSIIGALALVGLQYSVDEYFAQQELDLFEMYFSSISTGGGLRMATFYAQSINPQLLGTKNADDAIVFVYAAMDVHGNYIMNVIPTLSVFQSPEEAEQYLGFKPSVAYYGRLSDFKVNTDGSTNFIIRGKIKY